LRFTASVLLAVALCAVGAASSSGQEYVYRYKPNVGLSGGGGVTPPAPDPVAINYSVFGTRFGLYSLNGRVGQAYNIQLLATDGTSPYSWSTTCSEGSTMPPGVSVSASGLVQGTPTAPFDPASEGGDVCEITVTGSDGSSASESMIVFYVEP